MSRLSRPSDLGQPAEIIVLSDDEPEPQSPLSKGTPSSNPRSGTWGGVSGLQRNSQTPSKPSMFGIHDLTGDDQPLRNHERAIPPSISRYTMPGLPHRKPVAQNIFGERRLSPSSTTKYRLLERPGLAQHLYPEMHEDSTRLNSSSSSTRDSFGAKISAAPPPLINQRMKPSPPKRAFAPFTLPLTKKWTCMNCKEEDIGCDGERPCSNCSEPGLACNYPGRPPEESRPRNVLIPNQPPVLSADREGSTRLRPGSRSNTPKRVLEKTNPKPAKPTTLDSLAGKAGNLLVEALFPTQGRDHVELHQTIVVHTPDADEIQMNQIALHSGPGASLGIEQSLNETATAKASKVSASGSIRLEVEDVKEVLSKIQSEMQSRRQLFTQALLRQAKVDSLRGAWPKSKDELSDPFASLTGYSIPLSGESVTKADDMLLIQTKNHSKGSLSISKWTTSYIPVQNFTAETKPLPKYRSIGRLGPNILAPNYRTLKYEPWDAENEYASQPQKEKYAELSQRYLEDIPRLTSQRKCKELVGIWRPWADAFLEDSNLSYVEVCYYLIRSGDSYWRPDADLSDGALAAWISGAQVPCPTCELFDQDDNNLEGILKGYPSPSGNQLALAGLACQAFREAANINLWHIASTSSTMKKLLRDRNDTKRTAGHEIADALCLVCYRHHCPTHGAYVEEEADKHLDSAEVFIDDNEPGSNIRQSVTLPFMPAKTADPHTCGVFCGHQDLALVELLGRQADGIINGSTNCQDLSEVSNLTDETDCSEQCFWTVANRPPAPRRIVDVNPTSFQSLSPEQSDLLALMMPTFLRNKRGPCLMSMALPEVSCLEIFYRMIYSINLVPHAVELRAESQISKSKARTRPDLSRDEFALTHRLDERPPFVPCSHSGPCQGNPDCSCSTNKIVCEWFCGCDMSCRRRYRGCICAGANRACFSDDRCECWQLNRECDPHLCGTCGAVEILDPLHKYNEQVRKGRCKNTRLQIDIPKRTVKGRSEVQGWGLFAGEDIELHDYIGEYKGEIVSNQESDRRGAIYHNLGQEYLFLMNRDQQIDASKTGNKMRFMNDSQSKANINVVAKKMLCNGVQRIMLYSKTNIKAGDELLYNYNYPSSVVKNFWERGQGPTDIPGSTTLRKNVSAKQSRKEGHFAKTSNVQEVPGSKLVKSSTNGFDAGSSTLLNGSKKRKRNENETGIQDQNGHSGTEKSSERPVKSINDEVEIGASDESEYEGGITSAQESESEESMEDDDDEEEEEEDESSSSGEAINQPIRVRNRQRQISATDKRLGGRAQRDAWMTRKRNLQLKASQVKRGGG